MSESPPHFDDPKRLKPQWLLVCSMAGAFLCLLISRIPVLRDASVDAETWIVVALNGTLGRFAPWDWFIILGAHPGVVYTTVLLLVIVFLLEGWSMRRRDYGRVYGYGALALIVAFAFAYLVDVASLRFADRIPPWRIVGDLDDLRRFYRTDILEMSSVDGFVDGHMVAWSSALFMLWERSRRTACVMLGFALLHAFCEVALGEQWPVAHLTALMMGAGIAGLGLLLLDPFFARAERHMADFFVAHAWRQLSPGGRGKSLSVNDHAENRIILSGRIAQEAQEPDARIWLRLVEREVIPVLRLQRGDYVLSDRPPQARQWTFKRSRAVRFIRSPRGEVFVVKAAWRWAHPFSVPRRIALYRLHTRNSIALGRLNFPVPRVIWVREGLMNLGMRRYCILVEEFFPGRPLDRSSYDEASRAIRLLAQLHENKRFAWGAISEEGRSSSEEYLWTDLRPRIMYSLSRLRRRYGDAWPTGLEMRIWTEFEEKAFEILEKGPLPFRLTHGDVTRNNFIVGDDEIKMLDLLTLRYEWAGWEIIKACFSFSHEEETWRPQIWQDYFREAGQARWREFRIQAGFATAIYGLREFSQGRKFGTRNERLGADPEMFALRLNQMLHEDSVWGDSPEDTDWQTLHTWIHGRIGSPDSDRPSAGAEIVDAPGWTDSSGSA